jgi:phosphoribosylaminoimidazole (AIR) synthetase
MVVVTGAADADAVMASLTKAGETVHRIGRIAPLRAGADEAEVRNTDRAWGKPG